MGILSRELKLVLWLQKHYIHSIFKPNDFFFNSVCILLCLFHGTGKENNLNNRLIFGFYLHKLLYEPILLSAWCVTSNHSIVYIHNSWSINYSIGLETCLFINIAPALSILTDHMYANSWELVVHYCGFSQSIQTSIQFCCTYTHHTSICERNSTVVNPNHKMRFLNGVGTNLWCLKCWRNPKLRTFVHYLYRVFAGTTRI